MGQEGDGVSEGGQRPPSPPKYLSIPVANGKTALPPLGLFGRNQGRSRLKPDI